MLTVAEQIRRVDKAADPEWKKDADRRIAEKANTKAPFSSLDLWRGGLEQPRQRRALGARFLSAYRQGLIVPTGKYIIDESSQFAGRTSPRHAPHLVREWIGR